MVYFLSSAKWGLEGGRGEEEKRGNQMNASPLCRQKAIICDCKIAWYPNKYHLNNTNSLPPFPLPEKSSLHSCQTFQLLNCYSKGLQIMIKLKLCYKSTCNKQGLKVMDI